MTELIIQKVIMFAVLMLIGILSVKLNVFKKDDLSILSKLLIKITFPCLGFSLIYAADITLVDLFNHKYFIFNELILSMALGSFGLLTATLLKLPKSIKYIHIVQSMFGNQGFIHIPILLSIFKNGEASIYVALFTLIDQILLWSLGVILISASSDHAQTLSIKTTLKRIMNPMNISMLAALLFTSIGLKLPDVILSPISTVGNTSFSLALIFLGATLSFVSIKEIEYPFSYFPLISIKMLVFPLLVAYISSQFNPPMLTLILTLMTAMPAMSAIPMMAESYDADSVYASKTVFFMTSASIITIPIVFLVSQWMGIAMPVIP